MFLPNRRDVLLISNFKKSVDKLLVLTDKPYTKKTGLIIACGIVDNSRGSIADVPLDSINNAVVVPGMVFTIPLKQYTIKKIGVVDEVIFEDVLFRLVPLIGGEKYFID